MSISLYSKIFFPVLRCSCSLSLVEQYIYILVCVVAFLSKSYPSVKITRDLMYHFLQFNIVRIFIFFKLAFILEVTNRFTILNYRRRSPINPDFDSINLHLTHYFIIIIIK